MTPLLRTQVVATVFGLLMVGTAAVGLTGPGIVAGIAALGAVVAGAAFRPAATFAVLLSATLIMLGDASHIFATLSGLYAAGYLLCRHAVGTPVGVVLASWPTIIAAVGFSIAGLIATVIPLQVPWLPLVAPLGALAIYFVATRPFVS